MYGCLYHFLPLISLTSHLFGIFQNLVQTAVEQTKALQSRSIPGVAQRQHQQQQGAIDQRIGTHPETLHPGHLPNPFQHYQSPSSVPYPYPYPPYPSQPQHNPSVPGNMPPPNPYPQPYYHPHYPPHFNPVSGVSSLQGVPPPPNDGGMAHGFGTPIGSVSVDNTQDSITKVSASTEGEENIKQEEV